VDLWKPAHFAGMRELGRIMTAQRIQIAHSHQFLATLYLAPLAKLCGVPRVVETAHVREGWRRSWIKRSFLIDRMIYRLVDRFIAVSRANAEYLVEQKGCPRSTVTVIYNGRDLKRFQPSSTRAASFRARWGIAEADKLLVHVGRLEPQKGHLTLLGALAIARRRVPSIKALFVGDGSLRCDLESEVRQLDLERNVIFAGFQPAVEEFLQAADLTVLPSFWEGLPLVAIESAAVGKAMVATSVDGTPEAVLDGVTGLLVEPGRVAELAEAITTLMLDEDRRLRMGAAARQLAEERFSLGRQVEQTAACYEQMIAAPSPAQQAC
jgi:glycosyltransferase involved in cell wall biosynthesis